MLNCWGANGSTWNILEPKWGPLFRLEFSPCVGGFLFLPKKEDNQVPDIYIYIHISFPPGKRQVFESRRCQRPRDAPCNSVGSWQLEVGWFSFGYKWSYGVPINGLINGQLGL